jgi:hypothetical protein
MTMPANNIPPPDPEELPPPELRLVVTDNLDPENTTNSKGPTVHWITGKQHPFMPSMNVECMFVSRNAVAIYVYSQSKDGKMGSRDVIPMSRVRLAHERMVPEILGEEISDSAEGKDPYVYEDDDDDGDTDDPERDPTIPPPSPEQPS